MLDLKGFVFLQVTVNDDNLSFLPSKAIISTMMMMMRALGEMILIIVKTMISNNCPGPVFMGWAGAKPGLHSQPCREYNPNQ